MDGYPRSLEQATNFDEYLTSVSRPLTRVIYINCPTDVIVERIASTHQCFSNKKLSFQQIVGFTLHLVAFTTIHTAHPRNLE
jgi:adenylate kinase family enzyme